MRQRLAPRAASRCVFGAFAPRVWHSGLRHCMPAGSAALQWRVNRGPLVGDQKSAALQIAHAGSRARVTSMGGLYDAATLRALVSDLALQKSSAELLGTPVWCSLSRLNFRYTRTDARAESSWKTLGKRERMNGRACATSLRARRHGGRHVVCGPSFETPRIAGGRR